MGVEIYGNLVGQSILNYRIMEKLAEGGMGVVYKAEDLKLQRFVALKFLQPGLIQNPRAKEMFLLEARSAAALDHSNICTIHEINEEHGLVFMVLHLCEGCNLREMIAPGPLPLEKALDLVIQVAQGLHEAHEKGVVHRDIKSANIMVDDRSRVKIMDFGLAKLKGESQRTKEGTLMGTIAYMSPEQALGKMVDHRTDIWSLGVVLYEMLSGSLPFRGEYDQAVIYSIINEQPENFMFPDRVMQDQIDDVLKRVLCKEPDRRYQTVLEFMNDLLSIRDTLKGRDSAPISKPSPFTRLFRSSWVKLSFLLSLVCLAILLIVILQSGDPGATSPGEENDGRIKPRIFVEQSTNSTGDRSLDHLSQALTYSMITDLAPSRHVKVVADREVATHVLQSNYSKADKEYRVEARILDLNTNTFSDAKEVSGESGESPHLLVDKLTPMIKEIFKISPSQIAADFDMAVKDITTSSGDALKWFLEGKKKYEEGLFKASILLLENALSFDTEFAMALRYIALNYNHLGDDAKEKEFLTKARNLISRLTAKEQLLIQAAILENLDVPSDQIIAVYREILSLYPDDEDTMIWIGSIYRKTSVWEEAIRWFNSALKVNKNSLSYLNLAYIYICQGDFEKAQDLLVTQRDLFVGQYVYHRYMAIIYMYQNNIDVARQEINRAFALDPDSVEIHSFKGHLLQLDNNMIEAEKVYRQLLDRKNCEAHLLARSCLARLFLSQGKVAACRAEIEAGLTLCRGMKWENREVDFLLLGIYLDIRLKRFQNAVTESDRAFDLALGLKTREKRIMVLHFKGLGLTGLGHLEKAREIAADIRRFIRESEEARLLHYFHHLQGAIRLAEKRFADAEKSFDQAVSLCNYYQLIGNLDDISLYFESFAQILNKTETSGRSIEMYHRILDSTISRLNFGDIYCVSLYRLGKLYQREGDREKAILYLQRFIQFWGGTDYWQLLVKEARESLKSWGIIED